MHSSRHGITIWTCKTKAIQADLGIFIHIHTYSSIFRHINAQPGIFRNYPGIFRTLFKYAYSEHCPIQNWRHIQNPSILRTRGIFRTLVYAEFWHIQNSDILRTKGILGTLAYSELWYIQNPGILRNQVYLESWHVENPRHIHNPVRCLQWSILQK